MDFVTFTHYMDTVKSDFEWMDAVSDALRSDVLYQNINSPSTVLFMLSQIFDDKSEWIDYFCFELDWGKKWKPGLIRDKDGNDVPLVNYDDLYRLLTEKGRDAHIDQC